MLTLLQIPSSAQAWQTQEYLMSVKEETVLKALEVLGSNSKRERQATKQLQTFLINKTTK